MGTFICNWSFERLFGNDYQIFISVQTFHQIATSGNLGQGHIYM